MVVLKDAVGPDSTRVQGYNSLRVGPDTEASAALTRLTPGLRADAEPMQPEIDPSVAALLAERHCAHRHLQPMMSSTFAYFVRVASSTLLRRDVNLVGPAGALEAVAQSVLERMVASQKWVFALAKVDAQG